MLAVLSESRHSLKLLECHCDDSSVDAGIGGNGDGVGSPSSNDRSSNVGLAEAMTLVNRLLSAKLVYRTMHESVGNVQLARPQQAYSVRGYFMPDLGEGYQFISNTPLRQHWHIDGEVRKIYYFHIFANKDNSMSCAFQSNALTALEPPVLLLPAEFTRSYRDKRDVLASGDLSLVPSISAPCITVCVQDISLYQTSSLAVLSTTSTKPSTHAPLRDCSAP